MGADISLSQFPQRDRTLSPHGRETDKAKEHSVAVRDSVARNEGPLRLALVIVHLRIGISSLARDLCY